MEPSFQWDLVESFGYEEKKRCSCFKRQKNNPKNDILEIAGALTQDNISIKWTLESFMTPNTILFQNAELKQIGEQDPASNLRFKSDIERNNIVVNNYICLYNDYNNTNTNPIVISTFSRKQRKYSFYMTEMGKIECKNALESEIDLEKTELFKNFLESFKISEEKMKIIRECSKGAYYNTYMADCISFVLQVIYMITPDTFNLEYRKPIVVNSETTDSFGEIVLTPITVKEKTWTPNKGQNYIYFEKTNEKDTESLQFMIPDDSCIDNIYNHFWDMITLTENDTKKMVRDHFTNCHKFIRWSDYCANDVDDAFTILGIINCFSVLPELSQTESNIMSQFKTIIKPWFTQLDISYP